MESVGCHDGSPGGCGEIPVLDGWSMSIQKGSTRTQAFQSGSQIGNRPDVIITSVIRMMNRISRELIQTSPILEIHEAASG